MTGTDNRTAEIWLLEQDKSHSPIGFPKVERGTRIRVLRGHAGPVTALALSPDDKYLVTANRKRTFLDQHRPNDHAEPNENAVRLWDVTTGKELRTFDGHDGPVAAVAFSADGKRLITGSSDGTTRIWDVATGVELCRLLSLRDGGWVACDAQGRFDADNDAKGEGVHWVIGNETFPLEKFRTHFHDPGLLAKHMGFHTEPLRMVQSSAQQPLPKPAPEEKLAKEIAPSKKLDEIDNSIGMRLVKIEAGKFMMGLSEKQFKALGLRGKWQEPEEVTISHPFYIGRYEVTQAEYEAVMGPVVAAERRPKLPVGVTWYNAVEFCKKLSVKEGKEYTLPTSAEWEYACRAGTPTAYHFGETISTKQANFNPRLGFGPAMKGVNREVPIEVGSFPANAWGLHDMHGNMSEWCSDRKTSNWACFRGGSCRSGPEQCLSGLSNFTEPRNGAGFRVVLRIAGEKEKVEPEPPPKLGPLPVDPSGHTGAVMSVFFSADDKWLVSASKDGTAKMWDVEEGTVFRSFSSGKEVVTVLLSRNAGVLAAHSKGGTVDIWDVESGKKARTIAGATDQPDAVDLSEDGKLIAMCCPDNNIRVLKVATGGLVRRLRPSVKVLKTVSFNIGGSLVRANLYYGGRDREGESWNVNNGSHDIPNDLDPKQQFRRRPYGGKEHPWLLETSMPTPSSREIWHVEWKNKEQPPQLQRVGGGQFHRLDGHADKVTCIAFSNRGDRVATGSLDRTAKLWDVRSGEEVRTFRGRSRGPSR